MTPDRRSRLAIGVVAAMGAVEGLQSYGVSLFTPEIARAFSLAVVSVLSLRMFGLIAGWLLPLVVPASSALRRRRVRAWVLRSGSVVCVIALAATGHAGSATALVLLLVMSAVAAACGAAVSRSMVIVEAGERAAIRALSTLQLATLLTQCALTLAVAVGLLSSWRTAFEAAGLVGLVVVVGCLAAQRRIAVGHSSVHPAAEPGPVTAPGVPAVSWKEVSRSWRATPSLVGLGIGFLAIGLLLVPFETVLSIYLHSRWQLASRGTSVVFLIIAITSLLGTALTATRSERGLSIDPARLATESWCALGGASLLLGLGPLAPDRALMVAAISIGAALVASLLPVLGGLAFSVVPAEQRSWLAAALASVLSAGAAGGIVIAVAVENRHGSKWALVALAGVGVVAAAVWRGRSAALPSDQLRVRDAAADRRRHADAAAAGSTPRRLECTGINFSYGDLQVLFDVDFTIDDGEVVALLGTNGAGKSTLLNVISGIGLPQSGVVRLDGQDITYLDAEDRVRRGLTQIPGGRAVFGSMTVIDNLRTYGYTLGRDRRAIDEAVERCLEAFPQLALRQSSLAATLSGGEQQMVGLSKALILRPRLLLIDELSLGLAPTTLRPLLDMVRRINSEGTALVIVEQSVNIALSLVDHAYFMEKGTMRFNGRAADLLERHDLLRAVFLEGAAKDALS